MASTNIMGECTKYLQELVQKALAVKAYMDMWNQQGKGFPTREEMTNMIDATYKLPRELTDRLDFSGHMVENLGIPQSAMDEFHDILNTKDPSDLKKESKDKE